MTIEDKDIQEYFELQMEQASPRIDEGTASRMKLYIDQELGFDLKREVVPRRRRNVLRYVVAAVSGFAAAAVIAFLIIAIPAKREARPARMAQAVTEKGQKASLVLPDGTKVWLNSDSRLSYSNFESSESRDVFLQGEGYFEVAKDPDHPFIVHTDSYDVTAVGTAFNISAYASDGFVRTTLMEGEVRIDHDSFTARLFPDQSMTFDCNTRRFTRTESHESYCDALWRNNELYIEYGTTLEELSRTLERNYNISFSFKDESLKKFTFGGTIRNCQLTTVLDLLSLSAPVKYRLEGGCVVFYRK